MNTHPLSLTGARPEQASARLDPRAETYGGRAVDESHPGNKPEPFDSAEAGSGHPSDDQTAKAVGRERISHVSPEAPREPVIPATASRGLAPVGGAGDLSTAAVAGSPGPAAPSLHPLPKRRELSFSVAALAYTWAAIERRARA